MALKRADIRKILENADTSNDDKVKAIMDTLHSETDELRDQLEAEKTARTAAEKERDAAANGKTIAEKALDDYKKEQTAKATRASKTEAFKQLLKDNGVLDKYIDRIVRLSGEDIDALELDDKGGVKDAKKHGETIKADWADYVGTTTTKGAPVDNPPTNTGSKMTKDQIINIKDATERQAAIAANPEAFGLAAKE